MVLHCAPQVQISNVLPTQPTANALLTLATANALFTLARHATQLALASDRMVAQERNASRLVEAIMDSTEKLEKMLKALAFEWTDL